MMGDTMTTDPQATLSRAAAIIRTERDARIEPLPRGQMCVRVPNLAGNYIRCRFHGMANWPKGAIHCNGWIVAAEAAGLREAPDQHAALAAERVRIVAAMHALPQDATRDDYIACCYAPTPADEATVSPTDTLCDDLRRAVELMATKVTPYGEREDGTTSAYIVGDSTWHRVLAIARGFTSDAARAALATEGEPQPQDEDDMDAMAAGNFV